MMDKAPLQHEIDEDDPLDSGNILKRKVMVMMVSNNISRLIKQEANIILLLVLLHTSSITNANSSIIWRQYIDMVI